MLRMVLDAQGMGVGAVNRLVSVSIVIQAFHDVDFAAGWPAEALFIVGLHPNGGPGALGTL